MKQDLLQEELTSLQQQNLYRRLRVLRPLSSVRALCGEKEMLLFCGNDYLGLSHHPEVIHAAVEATRQYGVGAGASRLISGTTELHARLEEEIARFKGKEKALVFSSGYLANLGVVSALAGEKDLIVMDKLCHASLIDAARLSGAKVRVFPHKNYDRCEEILKKSGSHPRKLIISDSVFSMDGDLADSARLVKLKERYDALLILDDAHGTGVLGLEGRGAVEGTGLESRVDVFTGTFSKSLGAVGGFAAVSSRLGEYLINRARTFIFATALPPALCAAILKGLEIIRRDPYLRKWLWHNAETVHVGLQKLGYELPPLTSPILPVVLGDEKKTLAMASALQERGFLIPAIRYPTVARGKARLRITLSAAHRKEDMDRLETAFCELARDFSN